MSNYIIYCRKSSESEERQILSIESQIKELGDLAKKLRLPVSEVLTESRSAKSPGRPVFGSLMERVSRGEIKGIISWKLDRLARNPMDGGAIVWALDQGKIEEIITPGNHLRNNSNDKFLMQLEFGMAKKYVDDLSDNVKRGLRMKLDKGWLPGLAPIGYLNETRDMTIIPDPDRYSIIRKMWELLLGGLCPPRIHQIAYHELGLRRRTGPRRTGNPLSLSSVYRLFTNPFYYGLIQYKGNVYRGKHQPMITKEEFWRAQELLGYKGKPRPQKHRFAFTGFIRCGECGCGITAEDRVNRYGSRYIYYHCTKKKVDVKCFQEYIQEAELERQMTEYLESIFISKPMLEFALEYLEHDQAGSREQEQLYQNSIELALRQCERKLANLNQMRLGELINDDEYVREKHGLLDEEIRLTASLKNVGNRQGNPYALMKESFIFANEAKERFVRGTPETKKAIIREIGSNFYLKDKKLSIDVKKPFKLIQKLYNSPHPENERFEPQNCAMNTSLATPSKTQFPIMGALLHDVRTFFEEEIKAGRYPEISIPD